MKRKEICVERMAWVLDRNDHNVDAADSITIRNVSRCNASCNMHITHPTRCDRISRSNLVIPNETPNFPTMTLRLTKTATLAITCILHCASSLHLFARHTRSRSKRGYHGHYTHVIDACAGRFAKWPISLLLYLHFTRAR